MGAIKPQAWRHAVEAYSEALVTGSGDWGRCGVDVDNAQGLRPQDEVDVSPLSRHGFLHLIPSIMEKCFPRPWEDKEVPVEAFLKDVEDICLRSRDETQITEDVSAENVAERIQKRMEQEGMLRAGPCGLCLPHCFSTSYYANKFLDLMGAAQDGVQAGELLIRFLDQHFGGLSDGAEMESAQVWCQTLIAYLKEKAFIEGVPFFHGRSDSGVLASGSSPTYIVLEGH